ncbi:MAG TPA: FAD-dependent oxidoreductase [Candidatus Krumholzibacteria bacterium]|nr:FAD-dependent oxidoreductase [Candidatus Krumholzibacteria bacterium]HPD70689.1 FAD-dependent oxidoreductase [Candidatus Krumholzibacteria bacterium]HRY39611.1 FAD-dependent oxidoreductase [Candidatus Krumholzibacteria bacterium]
MIMPRRIPDIAVIGAGVAGLACAERLAENGLQVVVFDKGRQPGGRVAHRSRFGLSFEHGAPGQRPLVERLASRVPVMNRCRVTSVEQVAGGWRLFLDGRPLPRVHTGLVLAMPAVQAVSLAPELADVLRDVVMQPTLSVLVGLPGSLGRAVERIQFRTGSLKLAIRQHNDRPGSSEAWVLHAADDFSRDNLECDPDAVARHLWDRFVAALGIAAPNPVYLRGHRWRYARTEKPLGRNCWQDPARNLGVCGDWCLGHGVDEALASGRALAARILGIPERPVRQPLALTERRV